MFLAVFGVLSQLRCLLLLETFRKSNARTLALSLAVEATAQEKPSKNRLLDG